jgi:hypothetical protein
MLTAQGFDYPSSAAVSRGAGFQWRDLEARWMEAIAELDDA